ncbi:MAG: MerR family transcriptional regulator [Burkholderiales bacterium]|nr:MerR family transcriptional regulator [Burkholderiales bacterium]
MIDHPRPEFLDAETTIALEELVAASGLPRETVVELVEWGVFQPAGEPWTFASRTVVLARRAARLRRAFDLDPAGLALAAALLERIDELEARLRELECQLLR